MSLLIGLLLSSTPSLAAELSASEGIVDAARVVPELHVALAYATEDNFLKKNVYGDLDRCFLHEDAAAMLRRAAEVLKRQRPELRFLAFDCLRPRRVQLQMWNVVEGTPQAGYVANPHSKTGSVHNYGCAVDLTLADAQGRALPMGTPFDHFGRAAQPRYEAQLRNAGTLSAEALANRLLLRQVMVQAGFYPISNEWWHFNCATRSETRRRYRIVP